MDKQEVRELIREELDSLLEQSDEYKWDKFIGYWNIDNDKLDDLARELRFKDAYDMMNSTTPLEIYRDDVMGFLFVLQKAHIVPPGTALPDLGKSVK